MKKLNPLGDAQILDVLRRAAPGEQTLLDIACGRGARLRALSVALPELRLRGIDADAENAAVAAESCLGAEILCGDAAALPYGKNEFDIVLCECSFSLFDQPHDCAAEIVRILRPGGVLLLGDLYARYDARTAAQMDHSDTVRMIYGREALEEYFTAAGLTPDVFFDRSEDLAQLLGQMVLDGALCECMDRDTLAEMKKLGTGYGLWLFRKEN